MLMVRMLKDLGGSQLMHGTYFQMYQPRKGGAQRIGVLAAQA